MPSVVLALDRERQRGLEQLDPVGRGAPATRLLCGLQTRGVHRQPASQLLLLSQYQIPILGLTRLFGRVLIQYFIAVVNVMESVELD